MKLLTLIRHAKSSWADPTMDDFDRPLNSRGQKAAPQIGHFLADQAVRPDGVLSSPALRALSTAKIICPLLGFPAEGVVEREAIYNASAQALLYTIQEIEAAHQSVALFGHMPGVQEFAHLLTGRNVIDHFPTCGAAQLELEIDRWSEAKPGCASLKAFVFPKMLDSGRCD